MKTNDPLVKKREEVLECLAGLKADYKQLEPGSVDALATGTAIAAARIALSKLQNELIKQRTNL